MPSHCPDSLKPWFLWKELLLSINRHVVSKHKLRISFFHLLVCFVHQLCCRSYGSFQ
ncbi:hypothetical protein SDJN02_13554 [Cucurbita argyrosperma subsp. argyrosperma]|nr:hypothetical protein SDJN02_13554 [Cucurbita argyrosperma subsp. argyrosperma]